MNCAPDYYGGGYRIYFGIEGKRLLLLLLGGNKSSQQKDIATAREYWQDYKERINMAESSYQKDLIEALKDHNEAAAYLSAAIAERDRAVFLLALRKVVE